MSKTGKIVGLVALILGAFGLRKAFAAGNTGKKISINIANVNKPTTNAGALVISVNAVVDNPTNHTLRIKKPYLTVNYNGNEIANSATSDKYIDIKANDRTTIKDINIQVPILKLGVAAFNLFTGKTANVNIDVIVRTEADGIPYTDVKHLNL